MSTDDESQAAVFREFCHVRPIELHSVDAALKLSTGIASACFDFGHVDSDGLKYVADTKIRFPAIPVLMLTRQHSPEVVLWALRARVFDVLLKPAASDEVRRCIERLQAITGARRTQSGRTIAASKVVIPGEARHRHSFLKAHLQRVIAHIGKNLANDISEPDMARLCELSPFQFSREFRASFGLTFRDYLCDVRLKAALKLLLNPDISVTDVAAVSGFNDPSYFTRMFRKRMGCVPSEFRRRSQASSATLQAQPWQLELAGK